MNSADSSLRESIFFALKEILQKGSYSHIVLKKYSQNFGSKDKRLFWEVTLGVIRWLLRIDWGLSRQIKRYKKLPDDVKICLRMGYYQLLFMDRIPPYSAVNETVEVAKKHLPLKFHKFTNAVLRKAVKLSFPVITKIDNPAEYASFAKSFPLWMVERWRSWFHSDWVDLLNSLNKPSPFTVWVNTHFVDISYVRKILKESGIECKPYEILPDEMLQLITGTDVSELDLYKEGFITPQDVASHLVVKVLDPKPEETVLDGCAAPGIKTAQIALKMENRGRVVACEINSERFSLLLDNIKRLGAAIVEPENEDIINLVERFEDNSFDRILIDAPCSDLGTIRRRPELKWKRSLEDVLLFSEKQKAILDAVIPKLKRGGVIVYSVCSFEREETVDVVDYIKNKYDLEMMDFSHLLPDPFKDMGKEGMALFLPHKSASDGFFIAKLRRRS